MFDRLATPWHPEWYHGHGRKQRFFEGWYYKLVDATRQHALAIIPGVLHDPTRAHAFVQVLHGSRGLSRFTRFPFADFCSERHPFSIRVGANRFSLSQLDLQLDDPDWPIHGQVSMGQSIAWPVRWLSPGAMGPFAFVPAMQCYHGVLGLDMALSGHTTLGAERICWDGGRGYIEKDWGQRFPDAWVWLQCNHLQVPASLTVSVARVPWLGRAFTGITAGLLLDGQLHRFATYLGSLLEQLSVANGRMALRLASRRLPGGRQQVLEIEAEMGPAGVLHGPTGLDMEPRVPESLASKVHIRLFERQKGEIRSLFEGHGSPAALEVVGSMDLLAPHGATS